MTDGYGDDNGVVEDGVESGSDEDGVDAGSNEDGVDAGFYEDGDESDSDSDEDGVESGVDAGFDESGVAVPEQDNLGGPVLGGAWSIGKLSAFQSSAGYGSIVSGLMVVLLAALVGGRR
jgi:hypothetical protein